MTTTADTRYVSPTEAAKSLGLSTRSVYRTIENGHLPAVRLRPQGALRIPATALERPMVTDRSDRTETREPPRRAPRNGEVSALYCLDSRKAMSCGGRCQVAQSNGRCSSRFAQATHGRAEALALRPERHASSAGRDTALALCLPRVGSMRWRERPADYESF